MVFTNDRFTLAARPVGMVKPSDFAFSEEQLREPADGEIVVRVRYISLDPAMRGWMNDVKSYVRPIAIGELMRALTIGEVVVSKHPQFPVGATVSGIFGVQEYAISNGDGVRILDPKLAP